MKTLLAPLLPLLLLLACRRPEVAAFGRNPLPIVVTLQLHGGDPRAEAVREDYAAALRAKLASYTMVVPAGEAKPEAYADLSVDITQVRPYADLSPGVLGTATGVAVGTLSALAGNRDAFFDGLFWGWFAGSSAADTRDWDQSRLGYLPMRVSAVVKLQRHGDPGVLAEFDVRARSVIQAMKPLDGDERRDETRVREEEAKAFAAVVVARLQEQFHWMPLPEPSYYRPAQAEPLPQRP